ncbi:relaxase/mobilization nuclease domain-containing protein [Nostoc sp. FACHB-190]|uniref:relaxase/mobilization nuclease domain-containing protein n=1 Tax=Nostoc sp. FACHB-190 TaxID=2692838 RepID=UPI001681F89A|nr:relaxase/mobilization nuclease domain-containing protein [Nostoc sp. FACHB-190]MBD2303812.1 relaxase/mobilization nuclease domain-containing protein [Nostoc sp. FACHB-190]
MITKIKANKSFRGTTKYVLEKEKAQIIGGNMYGITTDKLVEQFTLSAHLNPQLKDPCYHLMLSVPKTDRDLNDDELANLSQRHFANVIVLSRLKGEEAQVKQPDKRISDTKLNQLVDEFIETELPAYDFFIARHSDKKHDHTHIVASRVNNLDGKSIRTWNNYAYSEHSARLLEREFNLTPVQSSWESKRKAMTRNQLERVERDGLPGEEIMRRAIEKVAVNKPKMPEFIERLWSEHQVKAIVSYYSQGGVRGIKFGIDVGSVNEDGSPRLLWKQGGNLNKYKCSFAKLQTELGISYDPQRDDNEIKRLNKFLESVNNQPNNQQIISTISAANYPVIAEINPQIYPASSEVYQPESVAPPLVEQSEKRQLSQKAINAIAEFIDSSSVESVLDEALPSVSQSLEQYQHSLAEITATLNDLTAVINQVEKDRLSQKAINAIVDFIDSSSVESVLAEALPSVNQSLDQYQQSLAEVSATFNQLQVALTQADKHQLSQKAINAIAEFIEQSTIESVLEEALPSVIKELEKYQQESAKITTTFEELKTAVNQAEKHELSQKAINAIAEFIEQSTIESALVKLLPVLKELSESQSDTIIKPLSQIVEKFNQLPKLLPSETQTLTPPKPKLKEELRAKLYNYYSADLQNLLVTDRDKEIATRALLDNKPVQDIKEILLASPAGWTNDEAKALVLIAQNKLASRHSQSQQQLDDKQQLQSEYLAIAVPVAVELINWQFKENGENSLRFKRATLSKQGKELVFTHDERGEIFRLKVNRNQSGELEYSAINVGKLGTEDITFWHDAERLLQSIIKQQQQSIKPSKGMSR